MKPQKYLSKEAKVIFNALLKHMDGVLEDIDTYKLSELAHALDMVQRANMKINNPLNDKQEDGVQITANGYTQVTGYVTVAEKYGKQADSLGAKFGITPADREKISAFSDKNKSLPQLM